MHLFYSQNIEQNIAVLEAEEARHCTQVLRHKEGDIVHLVDGKGNFYKGELAAISKKSCTISILEHSATYKQRATYLHIAIAPTKNIARLEWFLEKATEIGIDEITPILCFHSERKRIRLDRLNKVLIGAMKQSLKAYLPKLNDLTDFSSFIQKQSAAKLSKYIAWCDYDNNIHLREKYQANDDVLILIGPEGDFSETEVTKALDVGFEAIGLGKNRLRTETAGIVACHTVNLLNEY